MVKYSWGIMRIFFAKTFANQEEKGTFGEDKWLYVLKNMDVLQQLPKTFQCEAFRKLKEVSDISRLTEDERDAYEMTLKHYRDAINVYEGAIETGEARGEAKKANSVAKSMKKDGVPFGKISKYTGLSVEEIEKL
jgi:predicted transposase/invertase (TIGR01784 family)